MKIIVAFWPGVDATGCVALSPGQVVHWAQGKGPERVQCAAEWDIPDYADVTLLDPKGLAQTVLKKLGLGEKASVNAVTEAIIESPELSENGILAI